MFALTDTDYDTHQIRGIFSSVEKAMNYAENVMNQRDLKWSDPSHNVHGAIWADSRFGSLHITPVEFDPEI